MDTTQQETNFQYGEKNVVMSSGREPDTKKTRRLTVGRNLNST
jgi:hypothetical protein